MDEDGSFVESEAEESGEESMGDSSDESDGEGDVPNLIASEKEEDEEEDDDDIIGGRHSKRRKVDDRLEEDDYALIRENTGLELKPKKFRRVRMQDDDDDEEEEEGMVDRSSKTSGHAAHHNTGIEEVFGSDDEEDEDETMGSRTGTGTRSEWGRPIDEEAADSDEDEFVVGDDGLPIKHRRGDMYSEPALLEAQDVFGLDFDPKEFDQYAGGSLGLEDEEYDDDDDEEEEEGDLASIYSGEGGGRRGRQRRLRKQKTKTNIYDVYDPDELERSHFTERDNEIKLTDVPERFQLRSVPVKKSSEGELDDEAPWIYQRVFSTPPISKQPYYYPVRPHLHGTTPSHMKPPSVITKIKEALNFMRNYFFEVPFIATYRKEYVEPDLDVNDLWKIWTWDEKWTQLQQRKQNLKKLFIKIQDWQFEKVREEPDKALTEDNRVLQEDDMQRLDAVQTEEELLDVYTHFMLYYGRDVVAMQNKRATERRIKRQKRLEQLLDSHTMSTAEEEADKGITVKQSHKRDFYAICQEAGLGSLAAKFGLTPEQFGENLRDSYQRHETTQHTAEPEDAAQDYIRPSGVFTSARSVLQGACHMVAMQIACEPLVRQAMRAVYHTRATVSVRPTKKGKKVIDDNHPCSACKYLRHKPVRELKGEEFLKLCQAEQDGLLALKISIDVDSAPSKRGAAVNQMTFFEEIRMLFYRDEFSRLVEKWNAQRAQAVAHALLKVLYPQMERELRTKLLFEAKEHVVQSCVQKLRRYIDIAPYSVGRSDNSYTDDHQGMCVMACAYAADKSVPGFSCFLDENGEVVDFLRLAHLLTHRNSRNDHDRLKKEEEVKRLRDVMIKRKPDIIVISAVSRDAMMIVDDFKATVSELVAEDELPDAGPRVELTDAVIARLYSTSKQAIESFPSYPELLRMAISLGRCLLEPLHEVTSLFLSHDEEIFALKMHPLQDLVPRDHLKSALERELVSKVNEVGVDVDHCLEHKHCEGMVPFVCGLGPRKANTLLKTLRQENFQLQNRSLLVTQCHIGPVVFLNCAGFVKINTSVFANSNSSYTEVLDSTRIHPETYEWARKMAVDALEIEETGDEANPSSAVEEVLDAPDKLKDLDLDAFAEELERQDYGNKRTTLYDIRDELFAPYRDKRPPFSSMSLEDKFTLLTGETPDSFYEGKLITCTVVGIVRRKPSRDVLDRANPNKNQMTGYWQCPFCLRADFPDLSLVWGHIDDGSCPGQGIGVRTRLENGLSGFILTKNLSDKVVTTPEERVQIGMTIHCRILKVNLEKFSVDLTCRSSDLADQQGKFSQPKDMYYDQVLADSDKKKEEALQQQPKHRYIKRVIVHPSFMNISYADAEHTLSSMEQGEAIFRPSSKGADHLTVTWKVTDYITHHVDIKEEDKPNSFSLGRSLRIGEEVYEDFDEILARFIQPMAANCRDLMSSKCYRRANGGERKELEQLLAEEKAKNPKRIPYFFSASKQYPSKFVLAYQPANSPKFELVTVVPDGFRYRGQVHNTVDRLVKWFKEHYRDPVQVPHPPVAVMGAGVPVPLHTSPIPVHMHLLGQTPYSPGQWQTSTPSPRYKQQQQQQYYGYTPTAPTPRGWSSYSTPVMDD